MKDDPLRWQRLKDVFEHLDELAPESRSAFLSRLRFDENTLFQELSELIEAEEAAADFLQKPIIFDSDYYLTGEVIGRYEIVREVGRGGMGTVFEAVRRDGEFDQRVAVKLTNRNLFSEELIERFRTERQILAKLEHPNIVRLLDGGLTRQRIPYFVMEFVEGETLTEFCAKNNLSVREKLVLFLQVCEAVAHAHRQLIVHRDLKPSNILVNADGRVKLLDFGIAKTLDSDAPTLTARAPLTPEYASPEQIRSETITTASDVYSLGVILYEILTGKSPCEIYGVERLDLPRGVCENAPARPSSSVKSRVRTNRDGRPTREAEKEDVKPPRGDLDNIVLKSLRKEAAERYGSVEQLAEDIHAYLRGLPVRAHPQSFGYGARKFVQRNRAAAAITAVAVLLIFAGVSATVWQSFKARQQRQIAERNFNQVRKIANAVILNYHDEIAKLEGSTRLREKIVADALEYLDAVSTDESENPGLLREMAVAYRKIGAIQGLPYAENLGKTDEAITNTEKSIRLLERAAALAPVDLSIKDELVRSLNDLGRILARKGENQHAIFERAVKISDETVAAEATLERRIYNLRLRMYAAEATQAETVEQIDWQRVGLYRKIVEDASPIYAENPNNTEIITVLEDTGIRLGNLFRWIGLREKQEGEPAKSQEKFAQAAEYTRQALDYMERRRALRLNDARLTRRLFVANLNLSTALNYSGRSEEALKYHRTAADLFATMRAKDPDNREVIMDELSTLKNEAEILESKKSLAAAMRVLAAAVKLTEKYERLNPASNETLGWLGYFYTRKMEVAEKQKNWRAADKFRQTVHNLQRIHLEKFNREAEFNGIGL